MRWLLLSLFFASSLCFAEIHLCADDSGHKKYSDLPCDSGTHSLPSKMAGQAENKTPATTNPGQLILLPNPTHTIIQPALPAPSAINPTTIQKTAQGKIVSELNPPAPYTELEEALGRGNSPKALDLIKSGMNIEATDTLGRTPLILAVFHGDLDATELLISMGANINAKDDRQSTVLMNAVYSSFNKNGYDIIKTLISHGAEVTASDNDGTTVLHTTVKRGEDALTDLLVSSGANVNARDNKGITPLHLATTEHAIELLIANGANINAIDSEGMTPLHLVKTKTGAEILIAHGANINALNNLGESCATVNARQGRHDVALFLRMKGAIFAPPKPGLAKYIDLSEIGIEISVTLRNFLYPDHQPNVGAFIVIAFFISIPLGYLRFRPWHLAIIGYFLFPVCLFGADFFKENESNRIALILALIAFGQLTMIFFAIACYLGGLIGYTVSSRKKPKKPFQKSAQRHSASS